MTSIIIKLTTLTGFVLILIDILTLVGIMSIDSITLIIKNLFSVLNAILFSLSSTLYIYKLNQEILHAGDGIGYCEYYKNSDLRVKGLKIIEATENLDLSQVDRFMIRDSILFRSKLKTFGVILEILFLYLNVIAYLEIYLHEKAFKQRDIYMLNLYISVISPLLSILFSYITVLCDNVLLVVDYLQAMYDHRDKEDVLFKRMKRVIEYPLLSILTCDASIIENREPVS